MAAKAIWLADAHSFPTVTDSYVVRERDGNPVGLPHLSQYSGSNVKILNSNDVKFCHNSLAVAEKNSAKLQSLIDAMPDSGGCIGIPHDLALTQIKLPTRNIRGIKGQPINFRLFGTRPGVQVYGMSEGPLFSLEGGPSGVVHTPTRTALCELIDLGITCRGTGVKVTWAGLYFRAHNVEVRSDSETEPAWHFSECYGMHLGRVGAYNSYKTIGFQFDDCIHITPDHLWSRANRIGVQVNGIAHRCSNFFGSWDVEGNFDWQIDFNNVQKSRLDLYMEGHKRIRMNVATEMEFAGDGFRIDEIDELSKLLNPKLFDVQLNRVPDLGTPYGSYNPLPVTVTGPNSFAYATSKEMAEIGHWVDIAPGLPAYRTGGKVMDVRWRAKGTAPGEFIGRVLWNSDGATWQNVPLRPSADWQEYAFERGVAPMDGARLFFLGEADSQVDFELVHIAEVGRRTNYCGS